MNISGNRIVYLLRRVGMKRRLFIGFLLVSVFPATILFTVIGISFYQKTVCDYQDQAMQISGEMQYRIEHLMEQQAQVLDEFASDLDIVKAVRKIELGAGQIDNALLVQQLQIQLLTGVNKGTSHMRAEILDLNGEAIVGIFENYYSDLSDDVRKKVLKSTERYFVWHNRSPVYTGEEVLIFGREIINFFNGSRIGWVVVYKDIGELRTTLHQIDTNAEMAVYDSGGQLLCASVDHNESCDEDLKIPNEMKESIDGLWVKVEGKRAYFRQSETLNWMLVVFQSQKELYDLILKMLFYAGTVYILAIGIMIYLSFLITKTVTEPLKRLKISMKKFSRGELEERVRDNGNDELTLLANEFNQMSSNIEYLAKEVYQAQAREKEAVLRALEAQINPHFLYNTLDMLNWMSYRSDNQDICKILRCLSDFFRLSLNKGKEIYTVGDELKHVQCYITIEQYKKINVRFHVEADSNILEYPCPKLIVQPLVENALIHGLEPKKLNGNIWVAFQKSEDKIKIEVSDDGVGLLVIPRNEDIYKRNGYGLENINERLKMLYGYECKVRLSERRGGGVTATICLPMKIREEHHVSYDCRG